MPGFDGGLYRGGIGAVNEHGDWPADGARQLEQVLHHVTIGVFDIDDDDIGLERFDDTGNAIDLVDHRHLVMAGLAQSFLDDRGTDGVFVDDKNGQVGLEHCPIHAAPQRKTQANCLFFQLCRI